MDKNGLKNLSIEELQKACYDLKKELFELRNTGKLNKKLDKPHLLKEKKKEIARVLTVINQKRNRTW